MCPVACSVATFKSKVNIPSLWQPSSDHKEWIKTLAISLIASTAVTDGMLVHLGPVCAVKYEFCEQVLPLLVHNVLSAGPPECADVLSKHASRSLFIIYLFIYSAGE